MDFLYFLFVSAAFMLAVLAFTWWITGLGESAVPAPWGLPLVGHLFFIGSNPEKTFLKWSKQCGPVFQLNLLGKKILVLNDRKSITECFSRQEFNSRTEGIPLFQRWIACSGPGIAFNEGPHAEEQRNFFLKAFRDHGMAKNKMETRFLDEIQHFLDRWRTLPDGSLSLSEAFSQLILNSISVVTASKRYDHNEAQEVLDVLKEATDQDTLLTKLATFVPGFVDIFSKTASNRTEAWCKLTTLQRPLVEEHSKSIIPGHSRNVLDAVLQHVQDCSDPTSSFYASRNPIAPAMRDIMAATVDASTATLEWFVLYGLYRPQVIEKLVKEIDMVIGTQRQPILADKSQMPYTMACILETMRFSSTAPFGLPHGATMDTEFRGIHVKKGTLILGNLYAVHHDPSVWDEPEDFKPERFLTETGSLTLGAWNKIAPFGLGKRSCIGSAIIEDQLFLIVASIYQAFSIRSETQVTSVEGIHGFTIRPRLGYRICVQER